MASFTPFLRLLDLLLPPRCASCEEIVSDPRTLCANCWGDATFISAPFCQCCGLPFELDIPDGALCLDCARCLPPFTTARAVFPYDDFSRQLILRFKHGDRTDLAPTLAQWMYRMTKDQLQSCDALVPVPLHWRRLGKRRYNQAAVLAHEISKLSRVPVLPDLITRIRHTPTQGHLSRMARQKNLQGAFKAHAECAGKTIMLIDDVLTTGATVLNCTNTLLRTGAKEVHVLTLARVIHQKTQ